MKPSSNILASSNNQQGCQTLFAPEMQTGTTDVAFTFGINGSLRRREVSNPQPYTEYYLFNSAANLKAYSYNGIDFAYYGYNASNTRTYKLSMLNMSQWVNGQPQSLNLQLQQAMFYPNAYLNFNQNGEYTKHYYNGSERIASRLGNATMNIAATANARLNTRSTQLEDCFRNDIRTLVYAGDIPMDMPPEPVSATLQTTGTSSDIFYYHINHLGSTAYVTDQSKTVTQGFLYAPFGEITTEYAPLWQNATLPKYAFNAKELDEETGMYYYEARYYKPPVFISRDPLMSEKPWLTPYNYCSNNPVGRVDPSGCEDMDNPIISTNGKLLGVDDNGWGGIPIIMDENIYNDLSSNNKKKISHSVAESKGQYLNVYDKGIKISDKTWTEIENHGGDQRLTPYVQNRSNNTVYYKPEGKVNNINMNPGHSTSEALPIAPYTDLYVPVDGVATTKYSDNVLKIPTGYTITITPEGGGRIHGKGGDFIRIASGYGWVDEKWLKEQQKKGDTDWNALFNKAKHIGKRKY